MGSSSERTVIVYLAEDEKERLRSLAQGDGRSLSSYCAQVLKAHAARVAPKPTSRGKLPPGFGTQSV